MNGNTFNERYFGLEATQPEIAKMVEQAEQWAKDCIVNNPTAKRLFILSGRNGTGKTMLLHGMHRYFNGARMEAYSRGKWLRHPPSVDYDQWIRVAQMDPFKDERYFQDLCEPDILLLDDIGAEVDRFKSAVSVQNICYLLEQRKHKWTALTTNVLPENWLPTWGKRVTERLFRNSNVVTIRKTPSYSLQTA